MKKTLLFAGLILALTASFAMAAGVSVNWKNACWGEEPLTNLTWTCTTNSNLNIRMTTSFKLDADYPGFVGVGVYMEGMVEAVAVPDWWELSNVNATDCRYGLMTVSADGSGLPNGGVDVCFDPWQGSGSGGLGLYSWDGNRLHANAVWAVGVAVPLAANTEYFALTFRVSAPKTVNSCTGCLTPAIWAVNKMGICEMAQTIYLADAYADGNQCVTWQSSTLPCAAPVPARNTTWGQVKSLYR